MTLFLDLLINAWRFLLNVASRWKKPPDYVSFEVGGPLPEFERPAGFLRRRLIPGPPALSLETLRERLDRLVYDGRVQGVVLRVRNLGAGWAALEELRGELERYREQGGRTVVHLTDPDTAAYYLACAADEVYAAPVSTLNVLGLRTRVDFLKDALGRIGVEAEVIAVSPYKSAGDAFVRNDFSKESREQVERLLDRRYAEVADAIARGRGMSADEARRKVDLAPYPAPDALAEGLIDGVCYEDGLPAKLGSDGGRARIADWNAVRVALRVPYRRRARRRIGLVSLSGTIVRGKSRRLPVPLPFVGAEQAGDESVVAALRIAEKDRRVAAILFHVDSRGGDALASDLIWREVERIREKKPVVVLMGAAAASGGYYVSAAADHIIARSNTITGSIGVILIRPTTAGLYGRLGVNPVAVERGRHAGILDPSRPPTADELAVLESQLRFFYDEFKDRVSRGRKMDLRGLEAIAGGRVWTGSEARERGLVDGIGGYRTAVEKARDLACIKEDMPGTVVKISPPRNSRPAPGDPAEAARTAFESMRSAAADIREPRVWATAPFDLTDD